MTGENAASHDLAICIIFHLETEKAWEWTRMKLSNAPANINVL